MVIELSYAKGKLIGNQPFPAVVRSQTFDLWIMVRSLDPAWTQIKCSFH